MNLQKQIEKTISYYQNEVGELAKLENLFDNLIKKHRNGEVPEEEMSAHFQLVDNTSKSINKIRSGLKSYLFDVKIEKLVEMLRKTLQTFYPDENIKFICQKSRTVEEHFDRFFDRKNYFINYYIFGFEVDGKKFLLPEIMLETNKDYSAEETLEFYQENLVDNKMILGQGDFERKEFQDALWKIVEANIKKYISAAIDRYKERGNGDKKIFISDLENILRTDEADFNLDEFDKDENE